MSERPAHPSKGEKTDRHDFSCTDHDVILQTLISYTKCQKKMYLPVSGSSGLGRIIVWEDRDDVCMVAEGNYVGSL